MNEPDDQPIALRQLWPGGLHRLPAPQAEPPYDDAPAYDGAPQEATQDLTPDVVLPSRERRPDDGAAGVPSTAVQGTLALSFPPAAAQRSAAPLRLVPSVDEAEPEGLPELGSWAPKLGQALVEVLAGDRPVAQLLSWTSEKVYREISARVGDCSAGAAVRPGSVSRGRNRPRVRSARVCQPHPRVAEVTVLIDDGPRLKAAALRLEATRDRWLCTAIELGR